MFAASRPRAAKRKERQRKKKKLKKKKISLNPHSLIASPNKANALLMMPFDL